jgi:hypothetical protein
MLTSRREFARSPAIRKEPIADSFLDEDGRAGLVTLEDCGYVGGLEGVGPSARAEFRQQMLQPLAVRRP